MTTELIIDEQGHISVVVAGQANVLPFTLADIKKMFRHQPPQEGEWERAIMLVEDGIAPLRSRLPEKSRLVLRGGGALAVLLTVQNHPEQFIRTEVVEQAFAVLAGYRRAGGLPLLPQDHAFAALLLLVREWTHHMQFPGLYLV